MKKGDERFKERNHKWAGKRGGREYARNKMKLLKFTSYYQLNFQWALTLSVRAEYIYSAASQATSPAPFKYLFNKYPY
jgi:hypothetical protein